MRRGRLYRWLTLPWRGELEVVVPSALTQNPESLGRMMEMVLVDRGANVTVEEGRVRFNTGVFGLISDGGLSVLDAGLIEFSSSGSGIRVAVSYLAIRFLTPIVIGIVTIMWVARSWLVVFPCAAGVLAVVLMRWQAARLLKNDIVTVLSVSGDGRRERGHE